LFRRDRFGSFGAQHAQRRARHLVANFGHVFCSCCWTADPRPRVPFLSIRRRFVGWPTLTFDRTIPMDLRDHHTMPEPSSSAASAAASLVGRFLVAAPSMPDERFQKSVVFICKHDDDGALGIIVNNK